MGLEVHIGFACGHPTDLTGGFAATRFVHDAAHTMRPGFIELLIKNGKKCHCSVNDVFTESNATLKLPELRSRS